MEFIYYRYFKFGILNQVEILSNLNLIKNFWEK